MAQSYAGHGHARLQAFLDDLGFERFGIRSSLAYGNPKDKGDGVHVFLSGEHRPYRRDRVCVGGYLLAQIEQTEKEFKKNGRNYQ